MIYSSELCAKISSDQICCICKPNV